MTHIGATVGGNSTRFSPLSPVAVPLRADPLLHKGRYGVTSRREADQRYSGELAVDAEHVEVGVAPGAGVLVYLQLD